MLFHVRGFHAYSDRYQIVGQEVDIEHQRIVIDQIDSARNGLAEEHQLLTDKFPGRILSDGKLNTLPRFVRDESENIEPLPQHGINCEEIHCVDELLCVTRNFFQVSELRIFPLRLKS